MTSEYKYRVGVRTDDGRVFYRLDVNLDVHGEELPEPARERYAVAAAAAFLRGQPQDLIPALPHLPEDVVPVETWVERQDPRWERIDTERSR